MTRDEYLLMLESNPATPNQRGAVMRECDRLGLTDRAERLATCATLLGLDALGSTAELTQGQAGRLVRLLQHTANRGELLEIAAAAGADDGQGVSELITWPEAITRIIVFAWLAFHGRPGADDGLTDHCGCCGHSRNSGCGGRNCPCGESGDIALNIQRLSATEGFHAEGRPNRPG